MKTHQFRITVTTGKKSYAPGEHVPLGGKEGISAEEVDSIEAIHGVWAGGDAPKVTGETDAQSEAREKQIAEADAKIAEADKKLAALQAVIDAQAAVDLAALAISGENAGDAELQALSDAEAALAAAKADAGL